MPVVKEVIDHIRQHVISESADSDPTQTEGMADRARLVLDTIESLRSDFRNIPLLAILRETHDLIPNRAGQDSFRRAMVNKRDFGERVPWLAIMEWVARGRESLDDGFERV